MYFDEKKKADKLEANYRYFMAQKDLQDYLSQYVTIQE